MPSEILIDDTHALMTPQAFQSLPEYSLSIPTGVEFGKAWRRRECDGTWLYCWFARATGLPGQPDIARIEWRRILL